MRPTDAKSNETDTETLPPPGWSAGMLHLTNLLAFGKRPGVRRRIAELYRAEPRLSEAELLAALRELVVEVGQAAAQVLAQAVGVTAANWVRFCDPGNTAAELKGSRAVLRRLDRIWGGVHLLAIEAVTEVRLRWPGPTVGHLVVLCGEARAVVQDERGTREERIQASALPVGLELVLAPGALGLVRRPGVEALLEGASAAGMALPALIAELSGGRSLELTTPAGRLAVEGAEVRLNGRRVRLSTAEMQALRLLAEQPCVPVARQRLG
ncbi:MAG: hypothetical protein ACRD1L_04210, partial [Terriglobales bacterium]